MNKKKIQQYIETNTDKYFTKTKQIVENYGESNVVYAVFIRKPSIYACGLSIKWLQEVSEIFNVSINIIENFQEGDRVGAGEPLMFIEGPMSFLSELETLLLQKIGVCCLSAWGAYMMSKALPNVAFLSMIARHCANPDMVYACEYGASVGSQAARNKKALGFVGCSTDYCKELFSIKEALGTMPHSLIGYAGDTLSAAQMYYETHHPETLTILVDYFGKEVTDALRVCDHFADMAEKGNLSIRLDTHGGRYLEGLNHNKSYDIIEKYVEDPYHEYQDKEEIIYLVGMGVSAAAIFYFKEQLLENGFPNVKIIVSSGFDLKKCNLMAKVNAPIDTIGTGSYIPSSWKDTYATADIISYNGVLSVKKGREFLLKKWKKLKG